MELTFFCICYRYDYGMYLRYIGLFKMKKCIVPDDMLFECDLIKKDIIIDQTDHSESTRSTGHEIQKKLMECV